MKYSKRLRTLLTVLLACIVWSGASAGGVGKKINAVKLSGNYFYAESTDPSEDEARRATHTLLATYINQYIDDNCEGNAKVTEENIPGIKYYTMDRAGNKRVFAFVEKAVILDGAEPEPQPEVEPEPEPESEPAPAPATASAPEPEPEPAPAPVAAPAPVRQMNTAAPASAKVDHDLLQSFTPVQNKILKTLLDCTNIKDAYMALQRYNAEYLVKRFGSLAKCKNKVWSLWLIYGPDGNGLRSFLSTGNEGSRVDALNGRENVSLDDYTGQGYTAIFFEFK